MRSFQKLEVLNLSFNKLTHVEIEDFRGAPYLKEVILEGNTLEEAYIGLLQSSVGIQFKL